MSEADVSVIQDEEVLRRMWQQTEDFSRKKEIRAHMYRLREDRLKNLYNQHDAPAQRTIAKGHEFTQSQGHTKSFADQSFQSIKSKEVRDAGSPSRDYSYQIHDLKENSNTGWNVESENKILDNGHTHVTSINANIAGQYNTDGGSGKFSAVDEHKQAVTEYQDDTSSFRRNETASATSATEKFSKNTNDGTNISSITSKTSSKFQQSSKSEYESADTTDFSNKNSVAKINEVKEENNLFKNIFNTRNSETSLRSDQGEIISEKIETGTNIFGTTEKDNSSSISEISFKSDQGELTSRKIEYPNKNTKVIVETRILPDGTEITSTKREIRGSNIESSHSEHHSQQSHSENKSKTSQSHSRVEETKSIASDAKSLKNVENLSKLEDQVVDGTEKFKETYKKSDLKDKDSDFTEEKNQSNDVSVKNVQSENNHRNLKESVSKRNSVDENHYQTTYQNDFSQKVSTDLSHQAWASTLRADTPSTLRNSSRGSSPFQSSTSSIRSSISPDKYSRRPSSRCTSPTKSPSHTYTKTTKYSTMDENINSHKFNRTERKSPQRDNNSPSPTRRHSYRYLDEETKISTKFDDSHINNIKTTTKKPTEKVPYSQSPEKQLKTHERSISPTKSILSKNETQSHEKRKESNTTIHKGNTTKTSPSRDMDREPSPSKVSFESDTKSECTEIIHDDIYYRTRTPSPDKMDKLPNKIPGQSVISPINKEGKMSPEKPNDKSYSDREPSPSKYGTEEKINKTSDKIKSTNVSSNTDKLKGESPTRNVPRSSMSPPKYQSTKKTDDFISSERLREEKTRQFSQHPRQLVTPSSSPTRKQKSTNEAPSTGHSSPTTSVSEIIYYSYPHDGIDLNSVVTDADDETFLCTTSFSSDSKTDERPKTLNIKRTPSPSKIPCRSPEDSSPEKQSLPRKSSLKKPSSDSLNSSPLEKPPTTFNISPTREKNNATEHKIVKKDRPDKPETETKIKERPSFVRSETYEERCRKILGMGNKDSLTIEAEKTVSRILDTLPSDLKPEATKSEPTKNFAEGNLNHSLLREVSPQRKIRKESDNVLDFITHEKETGDKDIVNQSKCDNFPSKINKKPKNQSRESSPTKLQDITKITDILISENTNKNSSHNSVVSKTSRSSVSPSRQPQVDSSDKTSKDFSINENTISENENFISSEKKQAIIDRVQKTLTKISPADNKDDRKKSPVRGVSKTTTSLQDIISIDTHVTNHQKYDESVDNKLNKREKETEIKITTKPLGPLKLATDHKHLKQADTQTKNINSSLKTMTSSSGPASKYVIVDKQNRNLKAEDTRRSNSPTKKVATEFSPQKISLERVPSDTAKRPGLPKQNSFSKISTVSSNKTSKIQTSKFNDKHVKIVNLKTKAMKNKVESESEEEDIITVTKRRKSNEKVESNKALNQSSKGKPTNKDVVDFKITRTVSDTGIKNATGIPARLNAKPECNTNIVTKTKLSVKNFVKSKQDDSKPNKPQSNLAPKPKSATALNSTVEKSGIIIDIQQAKSSRENSPDRICPTPVDFTEDTGKPRLPDDVSEPDDDQRYRNHSTIHEYESHVDDIVEISEDEEATRKISEVDRVTGSDECLLSVNAKVNKFLREADNSKITKESSYKFKEIEKSVHSDYIGDDNDECLLSVSEKVSKFASSHEKPIKDSSVSQFPKDFNETPEYQDDYKKLTVNDKANIFIKSAQKSEAQVKSMEPDTHLDHSDINKSFKSDECPSSVSDKVNKFVKNAVKITDNIKIKKNILMTSTNEDKSTEDHENKIESYTKETVSSHAKVKDYVSPNLKTSEKIPLGKITTLCGSESVKKAKELFETIASKQTEEKNEVSCLRSTKLTDIGVYQKSTPTDSTIALHPSDDSESDIEVVGIHQKNNITSKVLKESDSKSLVNRPLKSFENKPACTQTKSQERVLRKSPERNVSSNTRAAMREHVDSKEEITKSKNIASGFYIVQKGEHQKEEHPKKHTRSPQSTTDFSAQKDTEKVIDDVHILTRHGSGKFGVELRRTSQEKITTERRRSSTNESSQQPCIEDIFDLHQLEQMLEKVVGYEQRRRIRAQMRLAKNTNETLKTIDTNTYTRHDKKKVVTEYNSKTTSPERKPIKSHRHEDKITSSKTDDSKTEEKEIQWRSAEKVIKTAEVVKSPVRHINPDKKVFQPSSDKKRQLSPEKKRQPSPEKKRQPSPEKKTRSQSPIKPAQPKYKSNRFNEYASAYMKKAGMNENTYTEITPKKEISPENTPYSTYAKTVEERKTTETHSSTERRSSTEISSSKEMEIVHINGKHTSASSSPRVERRAKSPVKKHTIDHIRPKSPSPDFTRKPTEDSESKSKSSRIESDKNLITKTVVEEKPSWITNRGLKKVTTETRTFTSKKTGAEKPKYRSVSPSKAITTPTDAITSSYGLGPMDADGRPLFGIKALRNYANNYKVKGTLIHSEYHSTNGSAPEGSISVTAYSTNPDELAKLLEDQGTEDGIIRNAVKERQKSKIHGLSAITTTKKFGGKSDVTIDNVQTKEDKQALREFAERDTRQRKTERQNSVKSLTDKFIKNAVDTSKSEKSSYPKAGLILRSNSGTRTNIPDWHPDSAHESTVTEVVTRSDRRDSSESTERHELKSHHKTEKSFLDSSTKVTGVQDILTRMKNADIVIEDGDSVEDSEARALLNKFLGATVLMTGMESYVTDKPSRRTRTVTTESNVTSSSRGNSKSSQRVDLETIWDTDELSRLLEECTEYEQRRRIRARLRQVMAEQEACAELVRSTAGAGGDVDTAEADNEREEVSTTVSERRNSSEKTSTNTTTTTTSKVIENVSRPAPKSASPFAKFRQLEKQNSSSSPKM